MNKQIALIHALENMSRDAIAKRKAGSPIKIAFISHLYTHWSCFDSLVEECAGRSTFSAVALAVPSKYETMFAMSAYVKHPLEQMRERGLPIVSPEQYNIHKEQPDIAFFQDPYCHVREMKYQPAVLNVHDTRSVLIPYCTEIIGGEEFQRVYFGLSAGQGFWRVFTASAMSGKAYQDILGLPDWSVPAIGNPEYDMVINKDPEKLLKMQQLRRLADGRRIILWTPHYNETTWSTWHILGRGIVRFFAEKQDDFFVVVRPHQRLIAKIEAWSPGSLPQDYHQELLCEMYTAGNFWLDADGLCIESVAACDGLISDLSSLLAKGMALKKSVLYTERAGHDGLGPSDEILRKHIHVSHGLDSLERFASFVLSGTDPLLPVPEEALLYFCGPADGQTASRAANYLEDYFFG